MKENRKVENLKCRNTRYCTCKDKLGQNDSELKESKKKLTMDDFHLDGDARTSESRASLFFFSFLFYVSVLLSLLF